MLDRVLLSYGFNSYRLRVNVNKLELELELCTLSTSPNSRNSIGLLEAAAVMKRAPSCRFLVLVSACLVRTFRGGGAHFTKT